MRRSGFRPTTIALIAFPPLMPRPSASQKAFSLIEVMLAATVLLVGLTSMIYALGTGSELLDTAHKTQIAQQLIDGEINRMRVADWGTIAGGIEGTVTYPTDAVTSTINISQNGVANGQVAGDEIRFAATNFSTASSDDDKALLNLARGFSVSLIVSTPRSDYRIFSYTVRWSSSLGKVHTRAGVTYIGRYGLVTSYKR